MAAPVRLLALEPVLPPHRVDQASALEVARTIFADGLDSFARLEPVFANSSVRCRYLAYPPEWYLANDGWSARAAGYLAAALDLLDEAARRATAAAGLGPGDIAQVVCVSTTGLATPSLEARLIHRLGLRRTVARTPVFGWGCAGGVLGLSRAADLARARPGAPVLLLVVELCSLAFRREPETVNVVGSALFGDGAAAAVLCCDEGEGPVLAAGGEHCWPDTEDLMGWRIDDAGFGLELRRDLPDFVAGNVRPPVERFLADAGMSLDALAGVVAHPGGPRVLTALDRALGLAPDALADARDSLAEAGNMSAASVLFVLRRALDRGASGRHLLTALGPGFTLAMALMDL